MPEHVSGYKIKVDTDPSDGVGMVCLKLYLCVNPTHYCSQGGYHDDGTPKGECHPEVLGGDPELCDWDGPEF